MLSKCANPACSAQLRYLKDGKIFRVEPRTSPAAISYLPQGASPARGPELQVLSRNPSLNREYFWLCSECARSLTIAVHDQRVILMPARLPAKPIARTAAAS